MVLIHFVNRPRTADSSSINQTHFVRSLSSFRNTDLLDVYRIQPVMDSQTGFPIQVQQENTGSH